jgi:hypothetical protein
LGRARERLTWRFSVDVLPCISLTASQTPGASLFLLCPLQTPCAQPPPLVRCSPRPAPKTLTEAHSSRRRQPFRGTPENVGKACGKQAAQHTGNQPDEGSVVTSRDTTAPKNEEHSCGHTHRKSMSLEEMSAAKQAGGQGETEKAKQPAEHKKRTLTTRQATKTQPSVTSSWSDCLNAALHSKLHFKRKHGKSERCHRSSAWCERVQSRAVGPRSVRPRLIQCHNFML